MQRKAAWPSRLATALVLASISCGGGSTAAPDAAVDLCHFSPDEPQWLVEGESLSVTIACQSGAGLSDLQVSALPAGAIFDESSQSLSWTPGLDQAAVYRVQLAAESLHASGELVIGVADAYDHPDNLPIVDPTLYTMELGLPVLFIAEEPGEEYQPMAVTYGGIVYQAEAKLRGKSSRSYPKLSYSLRFDDRSFGETDFADFGNRDRVILTSTFDDNSYLRQRLAYDLWSRLEPTISIEAYSAVVYRGTEYRGIYTISDHVNATLMQRSGLPRAGNLYKAETHDANFKLTARDGEAKTTLSQGYSKTEGKPDEGEPEAFADLEELVSFVAEADDATFNQEIADRIEVDDYAAWWLQATFVLAYDTAGKNSYHYHGPTQKWRVAPWDFNGSFGQSWDTTRESADDLQTFFPRNRLFERLLAHPELGPSIRARYQEVLDGPFALQSLEQTIDHYLTQMGRNTERDWARWQDEYYAFDRWSGRTDFTTHSEEVQYLRDWLDQRWQFAYDNYLSAE